MSRQRTDRRSSPRTAAASTRRTVVVLPVAMKEARKFLSPGQYLHITDLVKQLADFGAAGGVPGVEPFGDFWELKAKGGILGKINTRIYFADLKEQREVVVLHAYKKEKEGATSPHVRIKLRGRLRSYHGGHFGSELIRYPA